MTTTIDKLFDEVTCPDCQGREQIDRYTDGGYYYCKTCKGLGRVVPVLVLYEWQLVDEDNWIFGEKIRGIVRYPAAEIYYDEEHSGKNGEGGWRCMIFWYDVHGYVKSKKGWSASRTDAILDAEEALLALGRSHPEEVKLSETQEGSTCSPK